MVIFYTDPHLGLSRVANTTPSSSENLRQRIFDHLVNNVLKKQGTKVCAGDLFDKYSNNEITILQGVHVADATDVILAGNHDLVNQADKMGSLQLIEEMYSDNDECTIVLPEQFSQPYNRSYFITPSGLDLLLIPHVGSQDLFDLSLENAHDHAKANRRSGQTTVLVLHCNYDLSPERTTDTTLNLTSDVAKYLLEAYDYILLGHEHMPAEHFDGRLIIIGNVFPTGMGDISDKRILCYHPDGRFESQTIWEAASGYQEFDHRQVPEATQANFVRITGEIEAGHMLELTRAVASMWRRSPDLYCVKLDVTMPGISSSPDTKSVQESLTQLPDLIRKELESNTELLSLWDRMVEEEKNSA